MVKIEISVMFLICLLPDYLSDVYHGSVNDLGFDWPIDDKLHYYSTRTAEGLIQVVSGLDKEILSGRLKNVRLLVIDSLSTVFRDKMSEFGEMVRAENELMANLAQLAMKFNLMVSRGSRGADSIVDLVISCRLLPPARSRRSRSPLRVTAIVRTEDSY